MIEIPGRRETGLKEEISEYTHLLENHFCLELKLNTGGLPLFKSTSHQLWPILGKLQNIANQEPFIIGLFCSQSKP